MRWHRDARHFVRRYRDALSERPVWLFSSGPLDRSAEERDIAPVRSVARATRRIGARGHVTFGGRLTPDPGGRIATGMAKKSAGDFRNREQVVGPGDRCRAAPVDGRTTQVNPTRSAA
jgi:menaquinone-dependent protoporphyrinogen oxidase